MADLANLGFRFVIEGGEQSENLLEQLPGKAAAAEASVDNLAKATKNNSSAMMDMVRNIERAVTEMRDLQVGMAEGAMAAINEARALEQVSNAAKGAAQAQAGLNAAGGSAKMVWADQSAHVTAYRKHLKNLDDEARKIPATNKMVQTSVLNLGRQFADVGVTAAMGMSPFMILVQQGPQIADALGMLKAEGVGISQAFKMTLGPLGGVVGLLGPIAIAAGAAAAGLGLFAMAVNENRQSSDELIASLNLTEEQLKRVEGMTITFGDTMVATWQVISEAIMDSPIGDAIDDLRKKCLEWLREFSDNSVREMANIVGAVSGGLKLIVEVWNKFPQLMAEIGAAAANGFLAAIEGMINKAAQALNAFMANMHNAMRSGAFGPVAQLAGFAVGKTPQFGQVRLGRVQTAAAGTARGIATDVEREFLKKRDGFINDLGQLTRDVAARTASNFLDEVKEKAGDPKKQPKGRSGRSGGKSDAEKEAERQAKELERAREKTDRYIESLEKENAAIGEGTDNRKAYNDQLEIEAALKRGDTKQAERIRQLRLEIQEREALAEGLKDVEKNAEAMKKEFEDVQFVVPKAFDEAPVYTFADAIRFLLGQMQELGDTFASVANGFDGLVRGFKSGDFSQIGRNLTSIVDGVTQAWKLGKAAGGLSGGIGNVAGALASAAAPYLGRTGRSIAGGVSLGAQVGSIIPGVGSLAGAVVGGVVGALKGLLGGKPSNNGAGIDIASGALSGGRRNDETTQAVQATRQSILQGVELIKGAGIELTDAITGLVIGTRDQSQIYTESGKTLRSAVGDPAAAAEAALQELLNSAKFVDETQEKLVRSMQAAGKGFDEITEALNGYAAAQQMLKDVQDQILQMSDPRAYDWQEQKRAMEEQRKAAQAAYDAGYLSAEAFAKLNGELDKLNNLQVDQILKNQLEDIQGGLDEAEQNLRDAYQREADAIRDRVSQFKALAESLKAFGDSLSDQEASPDSYRAARAAFEDVSARARRGDIDALEDLQATSERLLRVSEEAAPDAASQRRDTAAVRSAVEAAQLYAQTQVDIGEQQLAELKTQVEKLIKIDESVLLVKDALTAMSLAISQSLQAIAAAQATAKAQTATSGGGGFNAGSYLAMNPDVQAAWDAGTFSSREWATAEQWAAFHWQSSGQAEGRSFAKGGSGIPGGMAIVGEHGPEVVDLPGGSDVMPNDLLQASLGSAAALSDRMDDLVEIVMAGNLAISRNTREMNQFWQRVETDGIYVRGPAPDDPVETA